MGLENQMKELIGKKLLILGGANLHCDLVIAAKNLGVETFVTDYLPCDEHALRLFPWGIRCL